MSMVFQPESSAPLDVLRVAQADMQMPGQIQPLL
jgi:hypothetical protein